MKCRFATQVYHWRRPWYTGRTVMDILNTIST